MSDARNHEVLEFGNKIHIDLTEGKLLFLRIKKYIYNNKQSNKWCFAISKC